MIEITTARLLGLFAAVALAGLAFSGGAAAADDCAAAQCDDFDLDQTALEDYECGGAQCDNLALDQSALEDYDCGGAQCDTFDRSFLGGQYEQLVA